MISLIPYTSLFSTIIPKCCLLFFTIINSFESTYLQFVLCDSKGIQADQRVLRTLIKNFLHDTDEVLKNHDIELSLITMHWFLTLFASVVHMKILLRIWDLFYFGGSLVLFQITLGMLKMKEPQLKVLENSAQIFNALSDIPGDIDDVEKLLEAASLVASSLNETMIETYRRRHLAYLMADQGALVGNPEAAPNLPKQHLSRSVFSKGKLIHIYIFGFFL